MSVSSLPIINLWTFSTFWVTVEVIVGDDFAVNKTILNLSKISSVGYATNILKEHTAIMEILRPLEFKLQKLISATKLKDHIPIAPKLSYFSQRRSYCVMLKNYLETYKYLPVLTVVCIGWDDGVGK